MPEWLRDVAVIHPTVQTMLNSKISSRFPTMILMLDFYFLIFSIGSFSITSKESIERRFNPNNTQASDRQVTGQLLSPLFIAAIYFLGREVTQMVSVRAQTTVFAYILEPENLLNLAFVFMTLTFAILMATGLGDDHSFRTGASITLAICYLQVLAYLKSILIDFAVFVNTIVYVSSRLAAFLVCLLITVIAFAQMWYTIFRQSSVCLDAAADEAALPANETEFVYDDDLYYPEEPEGPEDCEPSVDNPFCENLYWSFYKSFTMMLGEIDDTIFYWNTFSLILFCIFYFMEVIILLNILIAIITDLYGVVTNDRAAIVFWSNRLAFITDMDMITNGPWKKTVMNLFKLRDPDDEDNKEEEARLMKNQDKVAFSYERYLWMKLIECFDPDIDSGGMGMILYVPLRVFISMFLIPFWLLLGILSAGWFWPPQVREGLFVQKVSIPEDSGESNELEKRIEEVTDLQKELKSVQENLVGQFLQDRKEVTALKDQVKGIKMELKEEMKNIKAVMTSLFEVQQRAMVS